MITNNVKTSFFWGSTDVSGIKLFFLRANPKKGRNAKDDKKRFLDKFEL